MSFHALAVFGVRPDCEAAIRSVIDCSLKKNKRFIYPTFFNNFQDVDLEKVHDSLHIYSVSKRLLFFVLYE